MSERENDIRIKFMHAGDIHLDTPVIGMTPEKSDERRRGLRATFMRMMEYTQNFENLDSPIARAGVMEILYLISSIKSYSKSETMAIFLPSTQSPAPALLFR